MYASTMVVLEYHYRQFLELYWTTAVLSGSISVGKGFWDSIHQASTINTDGLL
jgi:hypothetical protein